MSGDSMLSKPTPSTLCAPRLFDSQATALLLSAICSTLCAKLAGEGGLAAWRPASREAAAASPAPTFAAESADGARLASPRRQAPAGSHVPHPHPSFGCPTAAWLLDFTSVRQGDFWAAAPCENQRRFRGEGGSQRPYFLKTGASCKPGFCNRSVEGFEGKMLLGSPSGQVDAALQGMLRSWWVHASRTWQHHLHCWSLQTILCSGRGCHPGSIVEIRLRKENQEPAGVCDCASLVLPLLLQGCVRYWWPWLCSL